LLNTSDADNVLNPVNLKAFLLAHIIVIGAIYMLDAAKSAILNYYHILVKS